MSDDALFELDVFDRRRLIERHQFFVDEAKRRLLSQFEDMLTDMKSVRDKFLADHGRSFDPNAADDDALHNKAWSEGFGFLDMIRDLERSTRLMIIAGMFHEWDKQVREWLLKGVKKLLFVTENSEHVIFKANFSALIDLVECLNWPVRERPYFQSLDQCRLVVNVYKHGSGDAFKKLEAKHPELFLTQSFRRIHYTDLLVPDDHLELFSKAIIDFWQDVPASTPRSEFRPEPKWLTKAMQDDFALWKYRRS